MFCWCSHDAALANKSIKVIMWVQLKYRPCLPYAQTRPQHHNIRVPVTSSGSGEDERTLLSQSIHFSIWQRAAKCFWSLMLLSHLSAFAWVTPAVVGRPTRTSSSITAGRYIKPHTWTACRSIQSEALKLQIQTNVHADSLLPRHVHDSDILIVWCISCERGLAATCYQSTCLHKCALHLRTLGIWRSM